MSQFEFDIVLGVDPLVADQQVIGIFRASKKILGKWRPVVGQEVLITDDLNVAFPARLPQLGDQLRGCVARPYDYAAILFHLDTPRQKICPRFFGATTDW
jgi:hypothetical protein